MKRLSAAILLILITLCFCGCGGGTKLSTLTGLHADDIEGVSYGYVIQSYAAPIKESRFKLFFALIDVGYKQCEDIYSLIYSDESYETMCFHVSFKDEGWMNVYRLPNKKICIDYHDGEKEYYYISNGTVYIPYFILFR